MTARTFSFPVTAAVSGGGTVPTSGQMILTGVNQQYDLVAKNPNRFSVGTFIADQTNTKDGTPLDIYGFGYACNGAYGSGIFVPGYGTNGSWVAPMMGGDSSPRMVDACVFDMASRTWRLDINSHGIKNHFFGDHYPLGTGGPNDAFGRSESVWGYPWSTDGSLNYGGYPSATSGKIEYAGFPGVPKPSQVYRSQQAVGANIYRMGSYYGGSGGIGLGFWTHKYNCTTRAWSVVGTAPFLPQSVFGSVPETMTLLDPDNNRIYYIGNQINGQTFIVYLDTATDTYGQIGPFTSPPGGGGVGGNANGIIQYGFCFLYKDATRKCIVWFCGAPAWPNATAYVLNLNSPTGWQAATIAGSMAQFGVSTISQSRSAQWAQYPSASGGDNCLYSYDGASGSFSKIAPPASGITGPWVLSTIPVANLPTQRNGGYQVDSNNLPHYSRFFFVPAFSCFAWIGGGAQQVALWKP